MRGVFLARAVKHSSAAIFAMVYAGGIITLLNWRIAAHSSSDHHDGLLRRELIAETRRKMVTLCVAAAAFANAIGAAPSTCWKRASVPFGPAPIHATAAVSSTQKITRERSRDRRRGFPRTGAVNDASRLNLVDNALSIGLRVDGFKVVDEDAEGAQSATGGCELLSTLSSFADVCLVLGVASDRSEVPTARKDARGHELSDLAVSTEEKDVLGHCAECG